MYKYGVNSLPFYLLYERAFQIIENNIKMKVDSKSLIAIESALFLL